MYAVMISGGKQYLVREGDKLKLEKIPHTIVGDMVNFDRVVMLKTEKDVNIGAPYVSGCVVEAKVIAQDRHKKVKIVKFKRRKHHLKSMGHRQYYTAIKVLKITTL